MNDIPPPHPSDPEAGGLSSRRVWFRTVLAGIVAAAVIVFGTALPASAHDALVSSAPVAGAVLDTAPTEIVLTYSGYVLPGTALVAVVDAGGRDYREGDPTVSETIVTVPVKPGLPGGSYEIRWAVTSEDGHPISGIIPFSVTGGSATVLPTASATALAAPSVTPAAQEEGASAVPVLPMAITGAAVVVLGLAAIVLLMRRQKRPGEPTGPGSTGQE